MYIYIYIFCLSDYFSLYTLWGLSVPEDLLLHYLDTWLRRESYPWLFMRHQESGWGKGISLCTQRTIFPAGPVMFLRAGCYALLATETEESDVLRFRNDCNLSMAFWEV